MPDHDVEKAKYFMEVSREHAVQAHERQRQQQNLNLKGALDLAVLAIRNLMLVNGAAVIALFAFLGAIEASAGAEEFRSSELIAPILCFACGVAFAVLAGALGYLVALRDHVDSMAVHFIWDDPYVKTTGDASKRLKWRKALHYAAMTSAVFALLSFGAGTCAVTFAISQAGI